MTPQGSGDDQRQEDKPRPKADDMLWELVERGLADRIYERLLARFKFYLGLALAIGTLIGAVLAWTGYRAIEEFKREVGRGTKTVQRAVAEFTDATVPEHRRRMARFVALESGVPFRERCQQELSSEAIRQTYLTVLKRPLNALEFDQIQQESARSKICSAAVLENILRNSKVQDLIVVLYKDVYDREPDPYAKMYWGVRFMHGYSLEDARTVASMGEEAMQVQARRAKAGVPK